MSFIKFKGLYLTIILALLILFLSLKPQSEVDTKFLVSDKLLHLFAYSFMILPVSLEKKFSHFSVFLSALAYGGCVELIQPFTGRESDIMDFFSNAAGIILGIFVARCLTIILKV